MTIKRTKTGHAAARAKRQRSVAAKVARARSSDAGDTTSKPMLLGYARVLVWELPFFGGEFVIWRIIIAIPAPIVAGLLARALVAFINRTRPAS